MWINWFLIQSHLHVDQFILSSESYTNHHPLFFFLFFLLKNHIELSTKDIVQSIIILDKDEKYH